MSKKTLQIDTAGRVVLPKTVRDIFGLKAGDELRLDIDEHGIRLEPSAKEGRLVREGKVLVFRSGSGEPITNEMVNSVLEEDRGRAGKNLGSTQ